MANCKDGSKRKLSARDSSQLGGQDNPTRPGGEANYLQSGPIRILRLAQVIDVTGLRKTKIYELQSQGDFPMRVRMTAHSVGWIETEVQAWLAKRVAVRRPPGAVQLGWGLPIERR